MNFLSKKLDITGRENCLLPLNGHFIGDDFC